MENHTYYQARGYYLAGHVHSALELLAEVVQEDPAQGESWELLGVIQHRQGRLAEALEALETATSLKPLSLAAQLAIADCYVRRQHPEAALAVYLHLAAHPSLPPHRLPDVVRGLARLGKYQHALEACRKAASRDPDCDQAAYGMAYYMSKCGYPTELVLPVLRRALELARENLRYRVALGMLYGELGDAEAAQRVLCRLTLEQLSSFQCLNCLRKLARCFLAVGDSERCQACRTRVEQLTALRVERDAE